MFKQIILFNKAKSWVIKYYRNLYEKACFWKSKIYIEIKNKPLFQVFKDDALTINKTFTWLLFVTQIQNWKIYKDVKIAKGLFLFICFLQNSIWGVVQIYKFDFRLTDNI